MSTLTPLVYLSTMVPSLAIPSVTLFFPFHLRLRPLLPGTRHPSSQAWTSQCRQALGTPHFSSCLSPLALMSDHPESLKKIVTFIYLCISCVFVCLCTCSGHRRTIRTPSLSWVPGTKVRVVMLGGGKPFSYWIIYVSTAFA